ncbi:MAG TPA: oligosaccharide flippase family protein [Bacteroidales bacterium]|nr:oligosaccharide flippase family protein [Bacteroidales bacterium]HPF03748.1 oligosaccharide flippase family protein [Bacteroidales bacterium]HPJ58582.1 oligosaccharide flippase family protein [Bacteroidales bacterium]HPR11259.1 oligosaccharide flippase family protein [Bacteroidales bacterium]
MRAIFSISWIKNLLTENKRFYNALFLSTISAILSQGLNFLTLVFITRKLGESSMGHFSVIQSVVLLLASFGLLGQNISSTALTSRFRSKYPNLAGLLIGNTYMLSASVLAVVGLTAGLTSAYFFPEIYLDALSRSLSLAVVIVWTFSMTFDMLQVGILIGFEAYKDLVKTDALKGMISISLILPLATRFGVAGLLTGYIVSSILGVLTNQYFIRKNLKQYNLRIRFKFSPMIIRKILNIGMPVFTASLFISFATWLTNKLIFAEANGAVALGIVFVCRQIMTLIQFFPVQISRVVLPIIAGGNNQNDKRKVSKLSLATVLLVCFSLAFAGLIFEKFILLAYNLDPLTAAIPYRIILITVIFSAVNMILGQFVIAGKNPWVRTYADIAIAVLMVVITLLLRETHLYTALPYAMLVSFIISDLIIIFHLKGRKLLINGFLKNNL